MNLQKILDKYGIVCDISLILEKWNESSRYYYDLEYLTNLITQINEDFGHGLLSEHDREKLIITSLFFNLIDESDLQNNRKKSSDFFMKLCREKFDIDVVEINQIILDSATEYHSTPLSIKFEKYENFVYTKDLDKMICFEEKTRLEQSHLLGEDYKKQRIATLEKKLEVFSENSDNLLDLINWVKVNY